MIETDRLRLRKLELNDYDAMLRVFSSFLKPGDRPDLPRQVRGLLRYYIDHQERHGYGMFAVLLKPDDILIGDCGLEYYANIGGGPEVEIAYEFDRQYWGSGYATEAAAAVRDYAFTTLGLDRIASFISEDNTASRRVVEKIGLTVEREIVKDGQPLLLYALNRKGA